MGIICKIAGHGWRNGYCRRCGASHKEHQWEQVPGKCGLRCFVCGLIKETTHKWEPVVGKCLEKCALCGEERVSHQRVRQGCISTCSRCRKTEGKHHWNQIVHHHAKPHPATYADGCKCTECGVINPHGEHRFEQVLEDGSYVVKCSVCGFIRNKHSVEDAARAREEYDANADEGITDGGVRGDW